MRGVTIIIMLVTESAYRICGSGGVWLSKEEAGGGRGGAVGGWTNYTVCFTPDVRTLLNQLYSGSEEDAQVTEQINHLQKWNIIKFYSDLVMLLSTKSLFRCSGMHYSIISRAIVFQLFSKIVGISIVNLELFVCHLFIRFAYRRRNSKMANSHYHGNHEKNYWLSWLPTAIDLSRLRTMVWETINSNDWPLTPTPTMLA